MQPGLCFDLGDEVVKFGDIVHFCVLFWRKASLLIAVEKVTHPLDGGWRGLEGNNLVRLRPTGKKRQKLASEAGNLRPVELQAELENFLQMLAFRLHLTGQLFGNVYGQLHLHKITAPRLSRQIGFV
jgi:hypothetical protein